MTQQLRINGQRLWDSLMEMARIGATGRGGCNRQALTDEDRQGRDLFVSWCKAAGCAISVISRSAMAAARCRRACFRWREYAPPVTASSYWSCR